MGIARLLLIQQPDNTHGISDSASRQPGLPFHLSPFTDSSASS
jgi:hypothetical protein